MSDVTTAKHSMTEKPKPASQAKGGSIFDRLTDTSTYHASHRARFNERPDVKTDHVKLQPASNINAKHDPVQPTVGRKAAGASDGPSAHPKPAAAKPAASSEPMVEGASSRPNKPTPASQSKKGGSIFDRLTDVSTYHASHRERFNADGTGRGLAGRDSVAKGNGSVGGRAGDLSSQVSRK